MKESTCTIYLICLHHILLYLFLLDLFLYYIFKTIDSYLVAAKREDISTYTNV